MAEVLAGPCAAGLDALALGLAAAYAHLVTGGQDAEGRVATVVLAALFAVALGGWRGGYRLGAFSDPWLQARSMLPAAGMGWALAVLAAAAYGAAGALDPLWVSHSALLGLALLAVCRAGVAAAARSRWVCDRVAPRAVVLGGGPRAARLVGLLQQQQPSCALRLIGVLDDQPPGGALGRTPYLGNFENLAGMLARDEVDQVIFADQCLGEDRAAALLRQAANHGVEVRLAPPSIAPRSPAGGGTELGGVRLLRVLDRPFPGWSRVLKGAEDLALLVAVLAVAAVPLALIALAIRLGSPGPVLLRERRVGPDNREFHLLRFRTTYDHRVGCGPRGQGRADARGVTPIGALLRRTSLDGLPQIICVLRGEMSFVGPRPRAPGARAGSQSTEQPTDRCAARQRVKPGLTGLPRLRGWPGPTETEGEDATNRLESDLEYIAAWSIWLDLRILLQACAVLVRVGNAR